MNERNIFGKVQPSAAEGVRASPDDWRKKTNAAILAPQISANMTWPKKVGILHCGLGGERFVQRMWKIYD